MLNSPPAVHSAAYRRWEWFLKYGQWFGLCMLPVSMVFSNFFMSFFGFWMVGAVILELVTDRARGNNLRARWSRFTGNRAAQLLVLFYLVIASGLLWTTDLGYGIKDLRLKLPVLFMAVLLPMLRPVPAVIFRTILLCFVLALTAAAMVCLVVYAGWSEHEMQLTKRIGTMQLVIICLFAVLALWLLVSADQKSDRNTRLVIGAALPAIAVVGVYVFANWKDQRVHDVRNISIFISHIRFSLMVLFGIVLLCYTMAKQRGVGITAALIIVFFLFFLWILESVTGFAILVLLSAVMLFRLALSTKKTTWKWTAVVLALGFPLASVGYLSHCYHDYFTADPVDLNSLETRTQAGETYAHYPGNRQLENGHFVYLYIAWGELYASWRERSPIHPDSLDARGHRLQGTLLRYLTSKNLRKDASGVAALTDQDIRNIESGITSVTDLDKSGLRARIDQILFEYDVYINNGNPTGHSVFQRLEFWKAAWFVIREQPWMGVGTGDVRGAIFHQYELQRSKLAANNRLNAHNQFLTLWASAGIACLLVFLLVLFLPLWWRRKANDALLLTFMLIIALSCVAEDTLETQAGVTFFAFWYVLLNLRPVPPEGQLPAAG